MPEKFTDFSFPLGGIDVSRAFSKQTPRQVGQGQYVKTTPVGVNVRGRDPLTGRIRGASRSGLSRYINAAITGSTQIQELATIVGSGYSPPGGTSQDSESGLVVTLVAVSGGQVYIADAGGTAWTQASNGTGLSTPLISTGIIRSTVHNQLLYFADGEHEVYYDPSDNTVKNWTASDGTLPTDSAGNQPRLIWTWRGRVGCAGLADDPQNWFLSAVDDATDFNYSPDIITPTQAVAGNNSSLGLVGGPITGVVPYSDDLLIFLGDSAIYMMQGDPMAGGIIAPISKVIGGAWGNAWCQDPYGGIYFYGNRGGVYSLRPGERPVRISQAIEEITQNVDTGANSIRMIWDERSQGFHVFITPIAEADAATHLFFEAERGAWWTDEFENPNHNPLCCTTFDGVEPGDRVTLIGSWDGYVRAVDPDAVKDDGKNIASEVILGPLTSDTMDELMLKELQATLGDSSGDVTYEVLVGTTAEAALNAEPVESGTWEAGRNLNSHVRRSGYTVLVRITSTRAWQFEQLRALVTIRGRVRQRGR